MTIASFNISTPLFSLLRLWHTKAQAVKVKSPARGSSQMGVKYRWSLMLLPGGIRVKSPINHGDGVVEIVGHTGGGGMPSPVPPPGS